MIRLFLPIQPDIYYFSLFFSLSYLLFFVKLIVLCYFYIAAQILMLCVQDAYSDSKKGHEKNRSPCKERPVLFFVTVSRLGSVFLRRNSLR